MKLVATTLHADADSRHLVIVTKIADPSALDATTTRHRATMGHSTLVVHTQIRQR